MSLLSTSSLFHYTKSLDTLIGILSTGLRFSTVREPYPQIGYGESIFTRIGLQKTYVDNHIVCFCDIPLTKAVEHRKYYNSYTIGLSKDWGKRNNVTPVRYVHSNSPGFSGKIIEFMEIYYNQKDLGTNFVNEFLNAKFSQPIDITTFDANAKIAIEALEKTLLESLEFIASGFPFFKAYETTDPLQRTQLKRYYDEREWRAYAEPSNKNNLIFSWDDIDFIICKTKKECEQLYKKRKMFAGFLSIIPISRLWQKIYSFEEIDANF